MLAAKSLLAAGVVTTPHVAPALALEMQPILPTALALKAAAISVESCSNNGYKVAATVLNSDGNILVMIKNQSKGIKKMERLDKG